MSVRNPQALRATGRGRVARGAWFLAGSAAEGTRRSALRQRQFSAGRVVVEKFSIAAPLDCGFQLAARFVFAEMFVEKIFKEFSGQRTVGFGLESLLHLAEQGDISQNGPAENCFAFLNAAVSEGIPFERNDNVSLFELEETKEHGGIDGGKQCVDRETECASKDRQIRVAAPIGKNFEQPGNSAGAGVWQHK